MILEETGYDSCGWLNAESPLAEWVLSSRIRLARNLRDLPFSQWASTAQLEELTNRARQALESLPVGQPLEYFELDRIDPLDVQFLMERHLISREMAQGQTHRMAAIAPDGRISILVGEEDHLRLQVLEPGLNLEEAWRKMALIDQHLGAHMEFAYTPQLGYLTACPTNVGTGIRCSVMVHLPALAMTKQMERILNAVKDQGFTIRGTLGEGSEIKGSIFQISNQVTLGVTEAEILARLPKLTEDLVACELHAQRQLLKETRVVIEDKIWRAWGALKYARVINHQEALDLLSALRLGVTAGIVPGIRLDALNELLLCTRPAHIQKQHGGQLEVLERDIARAEYIRRRLNGRQREAGA